MEARFSHQRNALAPAIVLAVLAFTMAFVLLSAGPSTADVSDPSTQPLLEDKASREAVSIPQATTQVNYSPGVYIFEDYYLEDPQAYPFIRGSVFDLTWLQIEFTGGFGPTDPSKKPTFGSLEYYIRAAAGDIFGRGGQVLQDGSKKKVMIDPVLHDGQAESRKTSGGKGGDQTPEWVYSQLRVPKIVVRSRGNTWQFPKFTDGIDVNGAIVGTTTYLNALERMIQQFAATYDGDPRIELIMVGGGVHGESMPYWMVPGEVEEAFATAGVTPYAWETYISKLLGIYKRYFTRTPLAYSPGWHNRGNQAHKRRMADDAMRQGYHISAHYLDAEPDPPYFALADWQGYYERYSWIRDYTQDAVGIPERRRTYVESGGNSGYNDLDLSVRENSTYWQILTALDKHVDYFGPYRMQSRIPSLADAFAFFNKYAGKTIQNTPGVWIAFRKERPGTWQPQKDGTYTVTINSPAGQNTRSITIYANYGQWLYQIDPDDTTVPLWDIGGKEGKFARRTDLAANKPAFYLDIDDTFAEHFDGTRGANLTLTYLDDFGSFELHYGGPAPLSIQKTGSRAWKNLSIQIHNARFANRLERNADLIFKAVGANLTLHKVEVTEGARS